MKRYLMIIAMSVAGLFATIVILSNLGLPYFSVPAIRSFNDAASFFKMIGEDTAIPVVSRQLSSIKTDEPEIKDYSFDADFYPYYAALSEEEKKLYSKLYTCINERTHSFYANTFSITGEDAQKVWNSVYYDHPELFWLGTSFDYTCGKNGNVNGVFLKFNELETEISVSEQMFKTAASDFLADTGNFTDAYQKEMHIHNKLLMNVNYSVESELNQTAFSAIVNKETVCAGYVKALQYLLMQEGIPCYYVSGISEGQDHAWAIVKLDDGYYNVDPTWNDSTGTFAFFNRSDTDFSKTHTRGELSSILPACKGIAHRNNEVIPAIVVE